MIEEQFVGAWHLVSWEKKDSKGKTTYPFGVNAVGQLLYTSDGCMSATLMKPNRTDIGIKLDRLPLNPKYIFAAFRYLKASATYINYTGTYEIVRNTVIHHVKTNLYPDYIGEDLVRSFLFKNENLILRAEDVPGIKQKLVWERYSDRSN